MHLASFVRTYYPIGTVLSSESKIRMHSPGAQATSREMIAITVSF